MEVCSHFVLITVGTAGDLFPFLSLALELRAHGHQVSFIGPAPHAPYVERSGLAFHQLGSAEQYQAVLDNPQLWHSRKGLRLVFRAAADTLHLIPEHLDSMALAPPAVLVVHPLALAGAALVRTKYPWLPIAAVYLAPSNLRTVCDPLHFGPFKAPAWLSAGARRRIWRLIDASMVDPYILPALNAARQRHGLAPVSGFVDYLQRVPDLSLTLFPDWFGPRQPDWPQPLHCGQFQLYDPNPQGAIDAGLTRFLAAGPAPIVFTPGSGNRHAAAYFKRALRAVQRLGRRAIFLTSHRAQVPAYLPDSVFWCAYAPLRDLLPQAAALVHHGGIGTTAEALRAGLPQLVLPLGFDQFDNGARVRALSAGTMWLALLPSSGGLVRQLRSLLADAEMAKRCRRLSANFSPGDDHGLQGIRLALENLSASRAP